MKLQKFTAILFALMFMAFINVAAFAQTKGAELESEPKITSGFPFLDRPSPLIGAWELTIDLKKQGNGFKGLYTFTGDGIMLADEPGGAFETTGHGNWTRISLNTANYTFLAYLGSPNGAHTATIKVVGSLIVGSDQKTWEGPGKLTVTAPNGTVIFQDEGTFKGKRIVVESLN
ncbi:MAG: hypothetical protein JNJ50_09640 [Acidobacteria bacterium]|nr:hypothetical protein [Acidobacteriota bacterium]